jgi:hypothetical protein
VQQRECRKILRALQTDRFDPPAQPSSTSTSSSSPVTTSASSSTTGGRWWQLLKDVNGVRQMDDVLLSSTAHAALSTYLRHLYDAYNHGAFTPITIAPTYTSLSSLEHHQLLSTYLNGVPTSSADTPTKQA